MRGILCRHILAIFRCNEIKFLLDIYILDRWRKDIKRRYTLIHSGYDAGEQRADSNRYSEMLNICYQMITLAAGSKEYTQDTKAKLYSMIDLYCTSQEPSSMTQTSSNVGCTRGDATTVDGSGETRGAPFCHVGADAAAGMHRRLYVEDELGMEFTTTTENDEDENDGEDEIERQIEIQSQ
ncbi:hypothetical protein LWI28_028293 [Acer negundo]|uniref:Protein FAR1-RELATED SEQUENCE n=1 Tax=Acer negundo TaxID=4023 RepID=A0AAD5IGR3_ACENE|nr:hypothetical protein LWI28_028293 [Acer negundo]